MEKMTLRTVNKAVAVKGHAEKLARGKDHFFWCEGEAGRFYEMKMKTWDELTPEERERVKAIWRRELILNKRRELLETEMKTLDAEKKRIRKG